MKDLNEEKGVLAWFAKNHVAATCRAETKLKHVATQEEVDAACRAFNGSRLKGNGIDSAHHLQTCRSAVDTLVTGESCTSVCAPFADLP